MTLSFDSAAVSSALVPDGRSGEEEATQAAAAVAVDQEEEEEEGEEAGRDEKRLAVWYCCTGILAPALWKPTVTSSTCTQHVTAHDYLYQAQ